MAMADVRLSVRNASNERLQSSRAATQAFIDISREMLEAWENGDAAAKERIRQTFIQHVEATKPERFGYVLEAPITHAEVALEKIDAELKRRAESQ